MDNNRLIQLNAQLKAIFKRELEAVWNGVSDFDALSKQLKAIFRKELEVVWEEV